MKQILLLVILPLLLFANSAQETKIKKILYQKFQSAYPQMHINNIEIKPTSTLVRKLSDYDIKSITITKDNLRRNKGSVMVHFTKKGKKRKLYFKYKIDATISLFKASVPIQKGREITPDIATPTQIPFDTLYHKPIGKNDFYHFIAKRNIKEDSILSLEKVKHATTIQRNDTISALIRDGGLVLQFRAKALQDGNIGDIIKIKKNYKKNFKAKVLSKNKVEVID